MCIRDRYKERSGRSKLSVVHDGMRFFKSIVWTALTYNPVRLFGGLGGIMLILGFLLASVSTVMALTTSQGLWNFPLLFAALVLAVGGVTLYTTGTRCV